MLDLDKRRAERDEKPHKVTLDGDVWELPARLPIMVAQDLARGDIRAVVAGTFGWAAGHDARDAESTPAKAQAAHDRAVEQVVRRLEPILDKDLMESVLDELYDMGDKPKRGRKEPQDHRPPAS